MHTFLSDENSAYGSWLEQNKKANNTVFMLFQTCCEIGITIGLDSLQTRASKNDRRTKVQFFLRYNVYRFYYHEASSCFPFCISCHYFTASESEHISNFSVVEIIKSNLDKRQAVSMSFIWFTEIYTPISLS